MADFYTLKKNNFCHWKNAENCADIIDGIEKSKQIPFEKGALRHWDKTHSAKPSLRNWLSNFGSIEELSRATVEELIQVEDIGDKIAESIAAFFSNEENRKLIERLKEYGIQLERGEVSTQVLSDNLAGKTFLFTGKLSLYS